MRETRGNAAIKISESLSQLTRQRYQGSTIFFLLAEFDIHGGASSTYNNSLELLLPSRRQVFLTLSNPGFWVFSEPGEVHKVPPRHNCFVIGRIMMKLGKLVKCYKLYLLMGFG